MNDLWSSIAMIWRQETKENSADDEMRLQELTEALSNMEIINFFDALDDDDDDDDD